MKDFIDILVQATGKILVLRYVAGAGPGCIISMAQLIIGRHMLGFATYSCISLIRTSK